MLEIFLDNIDSKFEERYLYITEGLTPHIQPGYPKIFELRLLGPRSLPCITIDLHLVSCNSLLGLQSECGFSIM